MSYSRGPSTRHWHSIDNRVAGPFQPWADVSGLTWPSASLALYLPLSVDQRIVVRKLWFANSSGATGNFDIGLYDAAGTALVRKGSTAKTSSTTEYVWDCADTTIGPGIYYLGLALSSASDSVTDWFVSAPFLGATGYLEEAGAVPLPATATFTVTTRTVVPVAGILTDTRVS